MKILITADIHSGYPNRLDDCIWSMGAMADYAVDHGIDNIFILGDLFHDRFNLDVEVCNKVHKFFKERTDINWMTFPGNHDMFLKNSWEINPLVAFNNLIRVFEDVSLFSIDNNRFWILPFVHYEQVFMKILKQIESKYEDGDVLLTHIGINGATLNECFLLKNWNIVDFRNSKFDRIFTGHFHCHQQVGNNAWYPGSPIPFRFDEGVVDHGFLIYDTDDRSVEFIELGSHKGYKPPEFITLVDDDIGDFDHAEGNNIRVVLSREYTKNELDELHKSLANQGAKSVKTTKYKEEIIDIDKEKSHQIDNMFEAWIEFDKPEDQGLNLKLLSKLDGQISQLAKEKLSVTNPDD